MVLKMQGHPFGREYDTGQALVLGIELDSNFGLGGNGGVMG